MLNTGCPHCTGDIESLGHIFKECLVSKEVWTYLGLIWFLNRPDLRRLEWLTWVFLESPLQQTRLFRYVLWSFWSVRNKTVYKRKQQSGKEIVENIIGYLKELDNTEIREHTKSNIVAK